MVFKKPYAFLIKHFKAINLILTGLMFWFFLNIQNTYNFLHNYVEEARFPQMFDVVKNYFSWWNLFIAILIIGICLLILSLFKQKKKPTKFYLILTIIYLAQIIILILAHNALISIQMNTMSIQFLNLTDDFVMFGLYLPVPFMIVTGMRGIGFNVKQFNFQKDLDELQVEEGDSEEFEVDIELDTDNIATKFNRRLRFMKYVYLENKFIIWSIAVFSVFAIFLIIFLNMNVGNKIYQEKELFKSKAGMEITVLSSRQTDVTNKDEQIEKDKFYVILNLKVKNTRNYDQGLPFDNMYLRVAEYEKFRPTTAKRDVLAEFGTPYMKDELIKSNETKYVSLVYELDKKYTDYNKRFEYLNNVSNSDSNLTYDYINVQLNVKNYGKAKLLSTVEDNSELTFSGELLHGTKIKIGDVSFSDSFVYSYTYNDGFLNEKKYKTLTPQYDTYNFKTIMKIKADITKVDGYEPEAYDEFFEKYGTLRYYIDGKEYIQDEKCYDLIPGPADGYYYLEIFEEAKDSDKIYMDFIVRNEKYSYLIYDKTKVTPDEQSKEGE